MDGTTAFHAEFFNSFDLFIPISGPSLKATSAIPEEKKIANLVVCTFNGVPEHPQNKCPASALQCTSEESEVAAVVYSLPIERFSLSLLSTGGPFLCLLCCFSCWRNANLAGGFACRCCCFLFLFGV